ncbi:MAG: hydroxyacid dehydrogenase [Alphaproteobacteria bacterium]|nr:MAG: hydroxyacid dehydrogenase [Alphaproteobacteria bacterium]
MRCSRAIERGVNPAQPRHGDRRAPVSRRQRFAGCARAGYGTAVSTISPSPAALVALEAAAGDGNWTAAPDVLAPRLVDWRGRYRGATPLLLLPRTVDQVAAIVRAAGRHRVALVPQGGNTGLVGGGIPPTDGSAVLVGLNRMAAIRAVDASGLTMTVEAGAILSDVHDAARAVDCAFPLSLGAKGSATIGGLIATNAGGMQVLRHGTMRALVVGLEAVLPDGSVLHQLTGLAKDNTGYDIKQLLIGGEGTLGIVTAAALRLVPAPRHRAVAWMGFGPAADGPRRALAVLARLRAASGGQVESFELMPDFGLQLLDSQLGLRAPLAGKHGWHALVELAGPEPLDTLLVDTLAAAAAAGEIADATVAASDAQAAALWRLREELPAAERRDGPAVHHDIAVAVAAMPDFAVSAANSVEAAFPGARVIAFGHLGDGNLHFNVKAPVGPDGADYLARNGAAITDLVYALVTAAGGSISAEHGIGVLKRAALARLGDPAKLAAVRAIKAALDPLGIMNPGKVI